jgi:hypothetical protein
MSVFALAQSVETIPEPTHPDVAPGIEDDLRRDRATAT